MIAVDKINFSQKYSIALVTITIFLCNFPLTYATEDVLSVKCNKLAVEAKEIGQFTSIGKTKAQEAIVVCSQAINEEPNNLENYYWRSFSYAIIERWEKVIEDSNVILHQIHNDIQALHNRGYANYRMGKYNVALLDINQAIELDADYFDAYMTKAFICTYMKDIDNAIIAYTQALRIKPECEFIYLARGQLLLADGQTDSGINDLSIYIDSNQMMAEAYHNRGIGYLIKEKYNEALADFSKAIKLDSNNTNTYLYRARAFSALGNKEGAAKDYKMVLIKTPVVQSTETARKEATHWLKSNGYNF